MDLEFGLFVGKVVHELQNKHFEHEHDIERWAACVRFAVFFSDNVECFAENFPVDQHVELQQKVVDPINLLEVGFEIEERELAFGYAHYRRGKNRGQ